MNWPVAQERKKKFKLFLSGPPGCFKTRTSLRLASDGNFGDPAVAVIDTEFGTDHYGGEFAFRVPPIDPWDLDADKIHNLVDEITRKPGNVKTLIFDSFSVYYDMLLEKWIDLFLLREITSAGHKKEYYVLQPRDYNQVNRDASRLVRRLLKCDLNIICICQIKNEYEFQSGTLKVVGQTADGWKRLGYYFDTLIDIEKYPKRKGWKASIKEKDRTNSFQVGEEIPWENDEAIVKYMEPRFGRSFYGDERAQGFNPADTKHVTSGGDPAQPSETESKPPAETPEETTTENTAAQDGKAENGASIDEDVVKADQSPVCEGTLISMLEEMKRAGFDKPVLIAGVKKLYDVEKPSMLTEGQAKDCIKTIVRGEFPMQGNTAA